MVIYTSVPCPTVPFSVPLSVSTSCWYYHNLIRSSQQMAISLAVPPPVAADYGWASPCVNTGCSSCSSCCCCL